MLGQLFRFLKFYWQADTVYRVHSPFVFDFITNVLEDDRKYYAFEKIETLRRTLFQNHTKINVTDFGAGSHTTNSNLRSVASIAQSALTPSERGELLFRLIAHYRPSNLLEFGTSLGITSLYQASPSLESHLVTLEGCPEIAKIARHNFEEAGASNITCLTGEFSETLPLVLEELTTLDYVLFDGNHRQAPTLAYFEQCLPYIHEGSIFVFDDIYWSAEMQAAWQIIKKHPSVGLSIDIFHFGIIFFRRDANAVQHFKLVPAHWKPWVLGFFK